MSPRAPGGVRIFLIGDFGHFLGGQHHYKSHLSGLIHGYWKHFGSYVFSVYLLVPVFVKEKGNLVVY